MFTHRSSVVGWNVKVMREGVTSIEVMNHVLADNTEVGSTAESQAAPVASVQAAAPVPASSNGAGDRKRVSA